jgi:hypothetical protein
MLNSVSLLVLLILMNFVGYHTLSCGLLIQYFLAVLCSTAVIIAVLNQTFFSFLFFLSSLFCVLDDLPDDVAEA